MTAPTASGSAEQDWPGQRLGLPQTGPGSVAGWGRRVLALIIDWLLSELVASVLLVAPVWSQDSRIGLYTFVVFAAEVVVLTATLEGSAGQLLLRLRVARLAGARLGWWRALVRTVLVCLVIPPVIYNRDQRGLHDLATDSVVVRR